MKRALYERGMLAAPDEPASYRIRGLARTEPAQNGQKIRIEWQVLDSSGQALAAKVLQENFLPGEWQKWGKEAGQAVSAALPAILKITGVEPAPGAGQSLPPVPVPLGLN